MVCRLCSYNLKFYLNDNGMIFNNQTLSVLPMKRNNTIFTPAHNLLTDQERMEYHLFYLHKDKWEIIGTSFSAPLLRYVQTEMEKKSKFKQGEFFIKTMDSFKSLLERRKHATV